MDSTTKYKVSAAFYFIITLFLVGFAIVSLVQGIRMQFVEDLVQAFMFYIVTLLLVFVSYVSYRKAHHKFFVLSKSSV
jgi:hypothetical protein